MMAALPINIPVPLLPVNLQAHVQPYQPPANPVAQNQAIDPILISAEQSRNSERQRTLAQPMGKNWVQKRRDALKEDAGQKLLKTIRQENDEKKKRTCEIRFWFQVRAINDASRRMNAHASRFIEWSKTNQSQSLRRNLSRPTPTITCRFLWREDSIRGLLL
jgi:hypothetical protein